MVYHGVSFKPPPSWIINRQLRLHFMFSFLTYSRFLFKRYFNALLLSLVKQCSTLVLSPFTSKMQMFPSLYSAERASELFSCYCLCQPPLSSDGTRKLSERGGENFTCMKYAGERTRGESVLYSDWEGHKRLSGSNKMLFILTVLDETNVVFNHVGSFLKWRLEVNRWNIYLIKQYMGHMGYGRYPAWE